MTPTQERKLLASLVRQFDAGPPSPSKVFFVRVITWVVAVILLVIVLQLQKRGLHPMAVLFLNVMIGAGIMVAIVKIYSDRTIAVIRPHVSRESVANRLKELGGA